MLFWCCIYKIKFSIDDLILWKTCISEKIIYNNCTGKQKEARGQDFFFCVNDVIKLGLLTGTIGCIKIRSILKNLHLIKLNFSNNTVKLIPCIRSFSNCFRIIIRRGLRVSFFIHIFCSHLLFTSCCIIHILLNLCESGGHSTLFLFFELTC